jgi:hypothetical protein
MVRFSRNSLTSTQKPGEQLRQRPFAAHRNRTCRSSSAEVSTLTGAEFQSPFLPVHPVAGHELDTRFAPRRAPSLCLILTGNRWFESISLQRRVLANLTRSIIGASFEPRRNSGSMSPARSGRAQGVAPEIKFAGDSLLEGDGFERSVPGRGERQTVMGDGTAVSKTGTDLLGNRRFESTSLHQRVMCEPDFFDQGAARGSPLRIAI